jgi:uncharacterized protein involved in outer membrane biogenesis
MKRIVIGLIAFVVLGGSALAILARSVLTGDNVRATIASQVSAAIGQPVTIGGLSASIYPRVTMDLTDVAIGQPTRVQLQSMHIGTSLGALFSRRIEQATVHIDGAHVMLPLPQFAIAATTTSGETSSGNHPPVEIVSIDEIVLRNVEVVRGERTLRGEIELVPQAKGVLVRRVALAADDTTIEMSGTVSSFSPIEGRIEARATDVDFDRLLAFLSDFAAMPSAGGASTTGATGTSPVMTALDGKLTFVLTLGRATTGDISLSDLRATAQVMANAVTFEPLSFGVFGGRYDGGMHLTLADAPRYRWEGKVGGINAATLMAFADSPNTISGTLAGTIALEGTGLAMEQALRTARGTARIDIADGAIAGLSLVRTIVLATSGRGGYVSSAGSAVASRGNTTESERFSRLGATLSLGNGVIRTNDFAMTSTDVDLTGGGTVTLATMMTKLDGTVRLSETLSKQAGTDLYRYAQDDGRITLPARVSGPIGSLSVGIDVGAAATRAIRNRAAEEAQKAIERNLPRGLGGLFPRRPPGR